MKTWLKITLPIIAVLLIIIGFLVYTTLYSTATRTAYLMIDEGSVDVDQGSGWEPAVDMMDLSIDDKIRTNAGKATVVFLGMSQVSARCLRI